MKKILLMVIFLTMNLILCYSMEKIDKAMVDRANRQRDESVRIYEERKELLETEVWNKLYVGMSRAEFINIFGKYITKETGDYVYFSIPDIQHNSRVKFIEGKLIKYEVIARSYGIPGTGYYQDATNLLRIENEAGETQDAFPSN